MESLPVNWSKEVNSDRSATANLRLNACLNVTNCLPEVVIGSLGKDIHEPTLVENVEAWSHLWLHFFLFVNVEGDLVVLALLEALHEVVVHADATVVFVAEDNAVLEENGFATVTLGLDSHLNIVHGYVLRFILICDFEVDVAVCVAVG